MPPLRFADDQQGVYGKRMSRRCLLRNLPFLPGPWQAFMKNLINEFGDEFKIIAYLKIKKLGPREKIGAYRMFESTF